MKATIVLIGDNATQNFGRNLMLKSHKIGGLGFEMARLPHHVSLKQPFTIFSLKEMEEFFDEFVRDKKKVDIEFEELTVYPNNSIGGKESGCLSLRTRKMPILYTLQKELFQKLEERFGPCPAPFDDDYIFHMTIAVGGTSFDNYKKAYNDLSLNSFDEPFTFNKLGLLYYDDDNISEGTYFCYKTHMLS